MIRLETAEDLEAIQHVNRLAFGPDVEAQLGDALRDGGFIRASLVAEVEGAVAGHILFSHLPIMAETSTIPAVALAPLAVLPKFQRQGIGTALVERGLQVCRQQGHQIVVVLGHPKFYPRFGFSAKLAQRLASPYSGEAFMALELAPRALDGVVGTVVYPPPFGELETGEEIEMEPP